MGRAAARDVLISLSAVERRLLVSSINGITVIDDSYNISFESAKNAFEYARSLAGRKVLITGGIVEQGRQSDVVNEAFGELIAKNFEVAVIAKNQFYKAIDRGIKKANSKTQIFFSQSPSKTPLLLSTIIKTGDVVLVQNELPETYWH
ncbi:hypothetical protein HY024_01805 [Candidatus Curtissbacteria bacterium]|nr:hypothetical protein [Candidatus Curtissbacteria bacterium]